MSTSDATLDAMDGLIDRNDSTPESAPEPSEPETDTFENSIDAAIEDRAQRDRLSDGETEPAPVEPEKDFTTLIRVQSELRKSGDLTRRGAAMPNELDGVDLNDAQAVRDRLLDLQRHEDRTEALEQAKADSEDAEYDRDIRTATARETALDLLQNAPDDGWEAASLIREEFPAIADEFLREWTAVDPDAASVWSQQNPPIDWDARGAEAQARLAEAEANVEQRHIQERIHELGQALDAREHELRADPAVAPYVDAGLNLLSAQLDNDPSFKIASPEQAATVLDAAVKTAHGATRAGREADTLARMLGPLDRQIARDEAARDERDFGVPFDLASEDELVARGRDEHLARLLPTVGPKPTRQERDADFFSAFEQVARKKPYAGFIDGKENEPTPGEKAYDAERQRRFKARRPRRA